MKRKYPAGAEFNNGEVSFRVWAPGKKRIDAVLFKDRDSPSDKFPLKKIKDDYFEGVFSIFRPGDLYKFMVNGIEDYYPDPASKFLPYGPHGPSQIINPDEFKWTDASWEGILPEDAIIYEMHIGTFTTDGNWKSASEKLQYLADLGINVIEVMPVSEFPGTFGWGYDGVQVYSPSHLYGTPGDLKAFVNRAHNTGIAVILDVVYNHLGPDGNYLGKYSAYYTTGKYKTDWGAAINYDGKFSGPVRDYFKSNAAFWVEEYHMDGLRLDATQNIYDDSDSHILAELREEIEKHSPGKHHYIITENEPQNSVLVRSVDKGGYGFDAMWNDDFHHSASAALTGKNEAYYTDYLGKPQEFVSAMKYGFLYQGQYYKWQKKRRGTPSLDLLPSNLVVFIQNHDQIANSGRGLRVDKLTSPSKLRAVTAFMILSPQSPMLFQGQEFGSSAPFYFFADHKEEISSLVKSGRIEFLQQFRSIAMPEMLSHIADPGDPETFKASILDHSEVEKHKDIYSLHKDLFALRRTDPVLKRKKIDGAVLSENAFVIRYFGEDEDRLLIVNLGIDLNLNPAPEPLLSPMEGKLWEILWSSEHPEYGGSGTAPLETENNWMIPGNAAVLLSPVINEEDNGKDSKKNFVE